jgi:IS4 transposase
MVSGYKKDDTYKRGYKYATITLAGDLAPIILGVEPVKENSKWEEEDAPSYLKAEMVDRLLTKAEKFVDIDEVYLDRGFHSKGVYAAIEERGIIYTTPVPKYEDDLDAIKKIKQHPNANAAVKHDLPVALDGEIHHYAEYLYVPSRSENGKYAVFTTNRERVETDEIEAVCRGYRRRWDIENQYKSIGECFPRTSSTDYRVRFCNFVLTALMYNLWRLTDYLIKVGRDIDIRSSPEIGFNTFVRAFGNFLRDIG